MEVPVGIGRLYEYLTSLRHSLHRVDDQVVDHLLYLEAVRVYPPEVVGDPVLSLHIGAGQGELDGLPEELPQVGRLLHGLPALGVCKELLGQVPGVQG